VRLTLAVLCGLITFAPAARPADWETTDLTTVRLKHAPFPPVLDGNVDERGWSDIAGVRVTGEEPMGDQFTFRMASHEDRLYLACQARVDTGSLRGAARQRDDAAALEDDAFEIVLDPGLTLDRGVRIVVTSGDCLYDSVLRSGGSEESASANYRVERATSVAHATWTVELSIPWAQLGLTGAELEYFGVNASLRRADGTRISLVPTEEATDLYGLAVAAIGVEVSTSELELRFDGVPVVDGKLSTRVFAKNNLSEREQFRVTGETYTGGMRAAPEERPVYLDDGASTILELQPVELDEDAPFVVLLVGYSDNYRRDKRPVAFIAIAARPVDG